MSRAERGSSSVPEYQRLVCPECTWWDPRKAAKKGIHRDVRCPFPGWDILFSHDHRLVVSKKFRRTVEKIPGVSLDFFDLPGDKKYLLAFAGTGFCRPRTCPFPAAACRRGSSICRLCRRAAAANAGTWKGSPITKSPCG